MMETDQIQIRDVTIFNGRNIYSHRPILRMIVDIGRYGDIPTKDIPGFNDRLIEAFPGLKTNCCGLGYEGGFLERLTEGTYMTHVLEHVVLEMQSELGYDVRYGKTRTIREPSLYYLVCDFENEVCGLECGKAAVFILNAFLSGEEIDTGEIMDYLQKVSLEAELGPSTTAIVKEAKKRGIPITRIGTKSLVRLGYGRFSRLIEATLTDATSCISADISCNKDLTKYILSEHQIPVPYGKVVYSEISAVMAANYIGYPVVIKPFDGNQGKGVHLDLTNNKQVRAAFREAARRSAGIIVEKYIKGQDFRVLVVGGAVRAVARRLPAGVTGDGIHTVGELVDMVNEDPNRGEHHEKYLTKIHLDDTSLAFLKKNKMTADTVPEKGRLVNLRGNGNLSTGGTAVDCTDSIHPDNASIAVRAANALGIDIAGIDFVTEDISEPILDTGGALVEVNTAPGIRMHIYPSEGTPRDVAKDIVDMLFPTPESIRFPIVSVTGTNGKTTVTRLIHHILSQTGITVGMTNTSGTYVGDTCICRGDHSGPRSARALLANKKIDAAILETARGGIIREGLGYDLADIGLITNITEDHIGLDGVETLADLAFVKSLVVEAVKKDGCAVLNAEDPMTPAILESVWVKTILFSKAPHAICRYKSPECAFVYTKNGMIHIADGDRQMDVAPVADIPITWGGRIGCNIENCLAAVSALYGLHVPVKTIAEGLMDFTENPGRFNLYAIHDVHVLLDYGHNEAGYAQVIQACTQFGHRRLIGVVGMPGDRMDTAITAVGKICAGAFDRLYIKEDRDLRGRRQGEVAALLYQSITGEQYPPDRATVIEDELDALKAAVAQAARGDLIVVFYERLTPLQQYLRDMGAAEVSSPPGKEHTGPIRVQEQQEMPLGVGPM